MKHYKLTESEKNYQDWRTKQIKELEKMGIYSDKILYLKKDSLGRIILGGRDETETKKSKL